MILTHEVIESLGTMNSYQLRLLGIGWPPKRGWVYRLVGREVSNELFCLLVELKGPKKKAKRIEILKRHGISAYKLFTTRLVVC